MKTTGSPLFACASRLADAALLLLAAALPSAVLLLAPGCEVESATDLRISVSPDSVTLRNEQAQEFVASGGQNYRWSLSPEMYGTLSSRSGERVVYTSTYSGGSTGPVYVVLTVVGTVVGTSGSVTNTASSSADALITQIEEETGDTQIEEEIGDLSVDPGAGVTLANGQRQSYTASGGTGTYTWELSSSTDGYLTSASGNTTIFTSLYTNNVVSKTIFLTCESGTDDYTLTIVLEN